MPEFLFGKREIVSAFDIQSFNKEAMDLLSLHGIWYKYKLTNMDHTTACNGRKANSPILQQYHYQIFVKTKDYD